MSEETATDDVDQSPDESKSKKDDSGPNSSAKVEVIKLIPALAWFCFALAAFILLYPGVMRIVEQKGLTEFQLGSIIHIKFAARAAEKIAVIYAANLQLDWGTPAYAMGITNRVDYLAQYNFDALERRPKK